MMMKLINIYMMCILQISKNVLWTWMIAVNLPSVKTQRAASSVSVWKDIREMAHNVQVSLSLSVLHTHSPMWTKLASFVHIIILRHSLHVGVTLF